MLSFLFSSFFKLGINHLKCTIQWHLVQSLNGVIQPSPLSSFKTFSSPKGNLICTQQSVPLPTNFQSLATTNLISVSVDYVFWMLHKNGLMQYVAFYVWFLSLSILFSIFIHGCSMNQNFLPFYGWIVFYCMDISHFVYPFISWCTFGLFPLWGCCE